MIRRCAHILFVATLVTGVIHFFFGWINSNVDSWFLWAFSEMLWTGKYPQDAGTHPYPTPSTGEPPLYSTMLAILRLFPNPSILLLGLQIYALGLTSYLLYRMLRTVVHKDVAIILTCLFALIPGNIVHVSYMMTDLTGQTILTAYTYVLFRYVQSRNVHNLSRAILVGGLSTLWKYSFFVFGAFAGTMLLFQKPFRLSNYRLPILAALILAAWVAIQTNLTGVFGLSHSQGIRYHTQMVWHGRRVPPESHPSMVELRKYVPHGVELHRAYWDMEPYFFSAVGHDWKILDRVLGEVGKAAILYYPLDYARQVFETFFLTHTAGSPWWTNLKFMGTTDPTGQSFPLYCGLLSTFQMCEPIIKTPYNYPVWNAYIRFGDWFYSYLFPFWSVGIFFPSLTWVIVRGDKLARLYAAIFLIGRIPIAMFAFTDSRYLLPFYPLMILISCCGIKGFIERLRRATGK